MSALKNKYEGLKAKYPDVILWFVVGDHIEALFSCALPTSKVLGGVLTHKDGETALTGFKKGDLDFNLRKMCKSGYRVGIVEDLGTIKRKKT